MDSKYRLSSKKASSLVYTSAVGANGEFKMARGRHSKIQWPTRTKLSHEAALQQAEAAKQKEN